LDVLGYDMFVSQLEAGVAAHHAGMVPPFKEVVEACFTEGLVKAVFATETLAVGINMPAKTVVIEKLSKFTGDHHQFLTPGEYTQLTGRAGRRGLDDLGYAVVLWSPFVPFDHVAALAGSRTFHLNSAFRPNYNMAANLVRSYTSERAHHLLNLSFAQYQSDRDVVRLEAHLERRQDHLDDLLARSRSPYGDIDQYRRSRAAAGDASSAGENTADGIRLQQPGRVGRDDIVSLALMKLRPGDVIHAAKGKYVGRVAVLSSAHRKGGMRLTGITGRSDVVTLTAADFDDPPRAIARIELPSDYLPTSPTFQSQVAASLAAAPSIEKLSPDQDSDRLTAVAHPVELDPQLDERMRVAAQAERVAREVDGLRLRVSSRGQSVARDFDRVLRVLENWGYVDGWSLTSAGRMLARTFHECDLLIAETLRQGLLDGLEPSHLAGLVSVFVYEHRSPEEPPAPWYPSQEVRRRWQGIAAISYELQDIEEEAGLSVHRPPDPTFIAIAFAWAAGEGFAEVVAAEELSGGDFVRTIKQLIDVLRQLAVIAPLKATRLTAEQAAAQLFRGVVAASSSIEPEEQPGADDDDPPR
ncbi:MAG: helicase-related protein, partial [Ilumatobacteraceae bacterium]